MDYVHRGARIIIEDWMAVKAGESVLIITEEAHLPCAQILAQYAKKAKATVQIEEINRNHSSDFADIDFTKMLQYDVVLGAMKYSLVTSDIVRHAVKGKVRFLSLPMSTNDGRSLLAYDFLTMDTAKSRIVALELLKFINQSTYLRVTTEKGTDIAFRKAGRVGNYFNGKAKDSKGFASSSFEVYIPVEEDQTEGTGVLDGSLGYLGKIQEPFNIRFDKGRIVEIEPTICGKKLAEYINNFGDDRLYNVSELGIGTNFNSQCNGNSYIEDESAYGTFHIGFGRNIALGGAFDASAHFDIVFLAPTIYADNRMIMEDGVIISAIPEFW